MLNEVKALDYYDNTIHDITVCGYNDISNDSDDRQKKIWSKVINNNLSARVVKNYDFLNNLATPDSEHYQIAQSRSEDINNDRVSDFYEDIYDRKKRMLRIPIGFEIDGKFYPASGNHRSRVRKRHQEKGNPPDGAVLILGDDLANEEKIQHLHSFAVVSNRYDDNQTARETEDDIVHQLRQARYLFESASPEKTNRMTDNEWCGWGKSWVCDNKEEYNRPRMGARLGIIVRKAFEIDRGQSLSMPDDSSCTKLWAKYWSTDVFEPGYGEGNNIVMKKSAAHSQSVKNILSARWEVTPEGEPREEVWLVARAGYRIDDIINKMETVRTNRDTFMNNMKEWNAHVKREKADFPLVTKILFPEQITGGGSMAVEWNKQSRNYDHVKIESLPDGRQVTTKTPL